MGSDGENDAEAGEMGDWGKGVEVVDAEFLSESLCNEACFVFLDSPIGLAFDLKDPLAAYNILVGRSRYGNPGTSFFKHGDFAVHGGLPI